MIVIVNPLTLCGRGYNYIVGIILEKFLEIDLTAVSDIIGMLEQFGIDKSALANAWTGLNASGKNSVTISEAEVRKGFIEGLNAVAENCTDIENYYPSGSFLPTNDTDNIQYSAAMGIGVPSQAEIDEVKYRAGVCPLSKKINQLCN